MSAELEKLLDQTRDALISGDFSDLERFAAAVETLTISLPQLDRPMAERLRRKADRNAKLLQAATRGIKAARQRLSEVSSCPRLTTYDAKGRRAVLPDPFGQQPRRA